ncbi:MAG TPA: hypothetical protein VK447_15685 [Myxococcaceae bacterium]|nr:hypothetical protein [Myxococcaceae bacterium]
MTKAPLVTLVASLSLIAGCNLLNTADPENARGRGARAFDPYASTASGAISLSLIQFNGCSLTPDGKPVAPGSLQLPTYPAECETSAPYSSYELVSAPPTGVMPVLRGQDYFLNQFIAMHTVFGLHGDYNDRISPATWIRKSSRFKDLDWNGLSVTREEWRPESPPAWKRETFYANANWMLRKDATFKLEVLDSAGTVRATITYDHKDLLAENPYSGRGRVSWTLDYFLPPEFPGDPTPHPAEGFGTVNQTTVKVAYSTSTNPFKTFKMPDVAGDGLIRVTWSLLPNQPFLFPVKFVSAQEAAAPTCYKIGADGLATNERVSCGFGLIQQLKLNAPKNGKFFVPGEKVDLLVSLRDGNNNGLHPRDFLPSVNDFRNGNSNGLLIFNEFMLVTLKEQSASESGFAVAGPLHKMRLAPRFITDYFRYPTHGEPHYYPEAPGLVDVLPGAADAPTPARYTVPLPQDIEPGTYVIYLKGHRYFMGERLNRMDGFFFQVGQEERTNYPNRVGNCQICHNGVVSLTNVMHGLSVDHVEGCKTCHNEQVFGHIGELTHKIHFSSQKYPLAKNDCSICHLTRDSAVTPSMVSCTSCHPSAHGAEYFDLGFTWMNTTPNAYTNCGAACHVLQTPSQHILPPN